MVSGFTCSLVWGTREIALAEGENLIGRTDENGTFVAKRMIHEPTPLADGDEVGVGSEVLSFHKGQGPGSTETG